MQQSWGYGSAMAYSGRLLGNRILKARTIKKGVKVMGDLIQQEATETTPAQETTPKTSSWDKVKAAIAGLKDKAVALFKAVWQAIKTKPWLKYVVVGAMIISLAGGIGYWRDRQLSRQIETLQTAVQVKAEQIKAVEVEKANLMAQIEKLKKQLTAAQIKHDSNIQEAGHNAYTQSYKMPDTDVLYNFNLLIDSARKRNAGR